jgi:hypothetical protein
MDSLGDYIYLIILVIAALSGMLKKKKKSADINTAPAKPKRSWEDVLRELTPIDEEEAEEEYTEPAFDNATPATASPAMVEYVKVEPAKIMSYENTEDSSKLRAQRNMSNISSKNKPSNAKKEIVTAITVENEFSLDTPDEARRAFIYSEIFNRKYQY